jgi:hypothetical protein
VIISMVIISPFTPAPGSSPGQALSRKGERENSGLNYFLIKTPDQDQLNPHFSNKEGLYSPLWQRGVRGDFLNGSIFWLLTSGF